MAGNCWSNWLGIDRVRAYRLAQKHFDTRFLAALSEQIADSEQGHFGELVVAVERQFPAHLDSARERALEVFGRLKVWDTPLRSGVLLYLNLNRHAIEIVADRGIGVSDKQWCAVCDELAQQFRLKNYQDGLRDAVQAIEQVLREACPLSTTAQAVADEGNGADEHNANHLSNDPVVL